MVYTLNGPGPLRGLPSLSLTNGELAEMGDLTAIDRAIERFNITPGKRIIKIDFMPGGERVTFVQLRGLKSRGFSIYGVIDSYDGPEIQWVDALIIERSRGPWPMIAGATYCYVVEDDATIEEPIFIPEMTAAPKFLIVDKITSQVVQFLNDAKYLWNIQLPSRIIKVDA